MSYKLKYIKYKTKCQAMKDRLNILINKINNEKEEDDDDIEEYNENIDILQTTENEKIDDNKEIVMMVINDIISNIEFIEISNLTTKI